MPESNFELFMPFCRPRADGNAISLIVRSENYFADGNQAPSLAKEEYNQLAGAQLSLESLVDAAESISERHTCNTVSRGAQRWELMPTKFFLSALQPKCTLARTRATQKPCQSFFGYLSKRTSDFKLSKVSG